MANTIVNDEIKQAFREGLLRGIDEGWETCVRSFKIHAESRERGKIEIKGKLPSLNEYIAACRTNPHVGAKMKQETEALVGYQLGALRPIKAPVIIHFVWYEKNSRRDKDNVAAAKKFVLDAMQKAGKLPNDNNKFIAGFTDGFVYGGEYGVEIIVEPITETRRGAG
jgi:Holliday junction resolvase RusA-like endonuclease